MLGAAKRGSEMPRDEVHMVNVQTGAPQGLLTKIKRAIDAGHVATWEYDKDGDFTHTPTQWRRKAWLRPSVESGALVLTLIRHKEGVTTQEVYGVYHGRFIEMLLAHFRNDLTTACAN
jgi:hypothetical protein